MKTKLYMKIISFILVLTMLFSLVACSTPANNTDEPETDENGNLIVDGVTINDSFVDLKINELIVTKHRFQTYLSKIYWLTQLPSPKSQF